MLESFEEAWGIWYDDLFLAANLKRVHEKMQPRIKVAKAALAKHTARSSINKHVQALVKYGAKTMQEETALYPNATCFGEWPVTDACWSEWGDWLD